MNITMFLNDNMRVLDYLYSKRDDEDFIRVSQQEVAEYFDLSRPTINRIFKALKENGYLLSDERYNCKYKITEKSLYLVEKIRSI